MSTRSTSSFGNDTFSLAITHQRERMAKKPKLAAMENEQQA